MLFQFHIQIKNIFDPPVWRRVLVPADFSFLKFHHVIQAAFGWEHAHLFQFSKTGFGDKQIIQMPGPWDDELKGLNAKDIKLSDIFPKLKAYTYIYDMGDSWEHVIKLEEVLDKKEKTPKLLAGEGACPPEDCGGFPGYEELKETLADPEHPEHEELKEWLGLEEDEQFDPFFFDLEEKAAEVQRIK